MAPFRPLQLRLFAAGGPVISETPGSLDMGDPIRQPFQNEILLIIACDHDLAHPEVAMIRLTVADQLFQQAVVRPDSEERNPLSLCRRRHFREVERVDDPSTSIRRPTLIIGIYNGHPVTPPIGFVGRNESGDTGTDDHHISHGV
jgi:hypothetical protein